MSVQENPNIKYLKQEEIGKVIADGLATLYEEKPEMPIDYLAKWLLNYQQSIDNEVDRLRQLEQHDCKVAENLIVMKTKQQKLNELQQKLESEQKVQKDYKSKVQRHQYLAELLVKDFPQYLKEQFKLTGVYIGSYDHPQKVIEESNDQDNAHLDLKADKQINYIGSSENHEFIIGKTRLLSEGVFVDVFAKQKEDTPVEEGNEQQTAVTIKQTKYVYVPSVIHEPRIKFFTIPKLGAYMCLPLFYNTYLKEEFFDDALQQQLKYNQAISEQENEIAEKKKTYEDEKLHLTEQGEETNELDEQFKQYMDNIKVIQKPVYLNAKLQYVVCCDTLGQDREISFEDRQAIESYTDLFSQSWEQTELNLLIQDVNRQIQYINQLNKNQQEFQLQQEALTHAQDKDSIQKSESQRSIVPQIRNAEQFLNEENEVVAEKAERLREFQLDQDKLKYEQDVLKFNKVKDHLQELCVEGWVLFLCKFRIVKYEKVIQNVLYHLGHTKQVINVPGTNNMNWKIVAQILEQPQFLESVLNYNYLEKKRQYKAPYATVQKLQQKVSQYTQEQIDQYNLGLGRLFRWFNLSLSLRHYVVKQRREQRAAKQQEREELLKKQSQLNDKLLRDLNDHKSSLSEEQLAEFNEQEWTNQWRETNPDIEIHDEDTEIVDQDVETE